MNTPLIAQPAGAAPDASPPHPEPLWSGPLTFDIQCRPSPDARRGRRHPVTIEEDGAVTTPHDLAAERVAMALGGYCSCVVLVERTLPRLRPLLPRVARRERAALRRDRSGRWRAPAAELRDCCRGASQTSLPDMVEHVSGGRHLAAVADAPPWQVESIVTAVEAASRPELGDRSPQSGRVREANGLERLWQSGIHPDDLPQLARFAAGVRERLPVSYFEAIAYSGHDHSWLPGVLRHRPDGDTAAWLAWLEPPTGLAAAEDWGRWLGFGVRHTDFLFALQGWISPGLPAEVAAATGWPEITAARQVIEWARIGCSPDPAHFALLARHGREYARPGSAALELAASQVRALGAHIDRTTLGVMLALAGNQPSLLAAVRGGARTPHELIMEETA